MRIAKADLQNLISNEADLLDVKAERVAEDIKRDLLKQKMANYGWWIKYLLGTIVILWVSFKFQLLESSNTPEFTNWFETSEEKFAGKYPSEMYGYKIGLPKNPRPTVSRLDILLSLQFPSVKNLLDAAATGKYVTRTGAYFLKEIISQKGQTLRYEHWHGSGGSYDIKDFLPTFHVGKTDCELDSSRINKFSKFDYVSLMNVWSSKKYAKGHEKQFENVDTSFCEMDFEHFDGIDDNTYTCHQDNLVRQRGRGNGHRIYALTPQQKKSGIEYKNPWADFFGFADANELSNNRAVQEHLCAPASKYTLLSILFREGLVGVATYYTTDIDSDATELVERLIGSFGSRELAQSDCTQEKFSNAVDGFALVGGIGVALAGAFQGQMLQRAVAGLGIMGGGGVAYSMYKSTKCDFKFA